MEQGQNNNAANASGQAQMTRDWEEAQSINHLQNPGIFDETGTHMMTMAKGAADVGMGAAQGALSLVRGAALGAANVADAVKNNFAKSNTETDTNADANANTNKINTVGGTNPSGVNSNTTN